jgi:thioredoxin 1
VRALQNLRQQRVSASLARSPRGIQTTEEYSMAVLELTKENFNATIEGGKTVIIDFWAPWCGPCRAFAPTFEAVSEEYPDLVFAKINTESEQELGAAFNIRSIPTLMVFREQVVLFSQAGMLPKSALQEVVKTSVELDMVKVHAEIAAQEQATKSPSH